jgi:hypothetical protein
VNNFWFRFSGAVWKEPGKPREEDAYRRNNLTLVFENKTETKAAAV